MIVVFEFLLACVLVTIMATLVIDERNHRQRIKHLVKLETYWDGINRRCVVRHNVSLDVNYKLSEQAKISRTKDISTHGVGLILDEKLPRRAMMELEIRINGSNEPLKARAKVMWSREAFDSLNGEGKRLFNTGLKFVKFVNRDHERKLFDYIRTIEKDMSEDYGRV